MNDALYRMWVHELDAFTDEGRIDWQKRKIAALEICKLTGVADLIRAIATDGALQVPPEWPETDVVPVGGGPGNIIVEVRTVHRGRKHTTRIGLDAPKGRKFDSQQIGEAISRGKYELKRIIECR